MNKERNTSKSELKCSQCEKTFRFKSEMNRHERSHTPQFICKICSKAFSFNSALRRHEKQHQRNGNVFCKECGKQFLDNILLKRHMDYSHKGLFECEKCQSTFKSEAALHTHSLSHTLVSERRYKCSSKGCTKSFNFVHHLRNHEFTHRNEKQHFCQTCGKGFIQLHHLKTHQKQHEPEQWLHCPVQGCDRTFPTEYARRRHLDTHDEGFCLSCGNLYTKKELETHIPRCVNKLRNPNVLKPDNIIKTDHIQNDIKKIDQNVIAIKSEASKASESDVPADCKTALGSCIVTDAPNSTESCICAQMQCNINDVNETAKLSTKPSSDSKVILDNIDMSDNTDLVTIDTTDLDIEFDIERIKPCIYSKPKLDIVNGTVKINDICEEELVAQLAQNHDKGNSDDVLYNSCKLVLGNCIVSGDDTIGEGCLCAKMSQESSHLTVLEMEDIAFTNLDT